MLAINLRGQTALVTGAGRGIGKDVALLLGQAGANVIVHYNQSAGGADEVVQQLLAMKVQAAPVQADLADPAAIARMFAAIKQFDQESLRSISILVNNAGMTKDHLISRLSVEDWDAVMQVNSRAAFLCAKHVIRDMIRYRYGRIISIGSVVGDTGNGGQSIYAMSKASLTGLTRALAHEYGGRNITVNAVSPGFITTDMTEGLSDAQRTKVLANTPLERFGHPNDVSGVVVFLASELASFITGEVLHVNGGLFIG